MKIEEIVEEFQACLERKDIDCFESTFDEMLNKEKDKNTLDAFLTLMANEFLYPDINFVVNTVANILRKYPHLGYIDFPNNPFIRLIMSRGSEKLYQSYSMEFILPYLQKNKDVDKLVFFIEFLETVKDFDMQISKEDTLILDNKDFSNMFPTLEEYPASVLVDSEIYYQMEFALKKYNAIVGRKYIINSLNHIVDTI